MLSGLTKMCCLFLFFISAGSVYADVLSLQSGDVTVLYEEGVKTVAREVIKAYPPLRDELSITLGQEVDFRPEVVLVKERDKFKKMSGSNMTIAFALPDRNLVVLDVSRTYSKPFTLGSTLKHELCHLVVHRGAGSWNIPRWFDEGVCQWSSGGIAELMVDEGNKALAKAVMSERLIGLSQLDRFPDDEQYLILAYEESKSVVEFIVNEYGKESLLRILKYLKAGDSMNESIAKSLSISSEELERNWHAYLKRKYTWFSYLSNNLYVILFTLAALITIYGFIRLIKKKRAYVDEEEEGEI